MAMGTKFGRYTVFNRAELNAYCEYDPQARWWAVVDKLCDRSLLPFPELPPSDPYNRPDYLTSHNGDTDWWTPKVAFERYCSHLSPRMARVTVANAHGEVIEVHAVRCSLQVTDHTPLHEYQVLGKTVILSEPGLAVSYCDNQSLPDSISGVARLRELRRVGLISNG